MQSNFHTWAEDQEVLVKKRLERLVSKIELSVEHTLAIKISKELIHSDEDVVVMFVYILPQGAVHYRDSDSNCHIAVWTAAF